MVCRDRGVPDGWVVVAVYHNPACPGDGANALVVKRPGRRDVVWSESPVPDGYSKTRSTHSEHFPGEGDNAVVIERKIENEKWKMKKPRSPRES